MTETVELILWVVFLFFAALAFVFRGTRDMSLLFTIAAIGVVGLILFLRRFGG